MPNEEKDNLHNASDALRKVIGSALCDFIAYLNSIKDPFIVGGQYPNDKLLQVFEDWLYSKTFDIRGVNESIKAWLNMCQRGLFCPTGVLPPRLSKTTETPPPQPPPLPSSKHVNDFPPDEGYFNGDDWKPEEDKKKRWQDEGEDWKKDKGKDWKDDENEGGFENGFQPT